MKIDDLATVERDLAVCRVQRTAEKWVKPVVCMSWRGGVSRAGGWVEVSEILGSSFKRFVIPLCEKELLVPGQASVPLCPIVTLSNVHRYFWPSMGRPLKKT